MLKIVMMLLLAAPLTLVAAEKASVVVMLGDSTTLCGINKPGAKLTDYVQSYLTQTQHLQATVINSGKGSDTAKGGYARLQQAVLAHDPAVVTVSFGLNDTGMITTNEYGEYLEKIIQAIQQKSHAKILLVTSTPFNNARHGWAKQFSTKGGLDEYMDANICMQTRSLARKYGVPICDLHGYFLEQFKKNPGLIDVLLMSDGVHVTDEGNRVASEYLAPMIATLITGPNTGEKK